MMEVRLKQNGVEKGSSLFEPYFRGLVLESYDPYRRIWYHRGFNENSFSFSNNAEFYGLDEAPPQSQILEQEYTVYGPTNRFLFCIAPPISFSSEIPDLLYNPDTQTIAMARSGPRVLRYAVTSLVQRESSLSTAEGLKTLPNPRNPEAIGKHGLPPQINAPVHQLAMSIVGDLLPPPDQDLDEMRVRQIVESLDNYLRTNYPYSLSFDVKDSSLDNTVDFLLNRKTTGGPCEYFASALAMLCRSLGIDSRVVTGYHGGDYNSVGGYYVVRQLHAHAWVEVLVPQAGWVQFDPTPSSRSIDTNDSFMKSWLSELTQFIQNVWVGTVIGFDNDSRRTLMQQAYAAVAQYTQPIFDLLTSIKFIVSSPAADAWLRLSVFVPALGLMSMVTWLIWQWKTRSRRAVKGKSIYGKGVRLSGEAAFLEELLRLIARKSGPSCSGRSMHLTPQEFVDSCAKPLGPAISDARWLVQTFYGLHFGGLRATPEMRTQISQALHRVRDALSATADKSRVAG
jgi:hypothetical protein